MTSLKFWLNMPDKRNIKYNIALHVSTIIRIWKKMWWYILLLFYQWEITESFSDAIVDLLWLKGETKYESIKFELFFRKNIE